MGPDCHYLGCRERAADVPWTQRRTAPPVPVCARHRARYQAVEAPRDRDLDGWVVDLLRDPTGHRRISVRPAWRREQAATGWRSEGRDLSAEAGARRAPG